MGDPIAEMAANIRDAATLMVAGSETYDGPTIRHGQVTAVTLSATGTTCSVTLGGTTITGVRCMAPYTPIVNDAAVLAAYPGGRLIAIGCTNRSENVAASWTPVIAGGWDIGNGTVSGWYSISGKVCHYHGFLRMGSTSTFGTGNPTFTLPVAADTGKETSFSIRSKMQSALEDNTGSGEYASNPIGLPDSTHISLGTYQVGGANVIVSLLSNTVPFTWAVNDSITYGGWYWAA